MIAGSRGQLGLELARQLYNKGMYDVIETDIHNLDITDCKAVYEAVRKIKPYTIINCAAFTNVDACETNEELAFQVNALGARNLAAAAYGENASILQVSTDYVFDGKVNVPRREHDTINPQSCYGNSKAFGEKFVRETNPRHYIVRTAWLYGEGVNFVRTMLKLANEKDAIDVVDDQIGSPTSTVDLASCITDLIDTEAYGTYHGTCEGACSWYDFAKRIFEIKGINILVNRISTEELNRPAKRPKYSVLDNYMLKLVNMNSFRYWEESLEEYFKGRDIV